MQQRKSIPTRIFFMILWAVLLIGALNLPLLFQKKDPNSIEVFTWGDYFQNEEIIPEFEKRTGIKVNLHYYTSNEEMRIKLLSSRNAYDLVIPSDYAVGMLRRDGALKPLDRSKLKYFNKFSKELLNLSYDPGNTYSIPNTWEIYGLGVDREELKNYDIEPSLAAVFDLNKMNYRIAMTPEPAEAVLFAATYLFGPVDYLSPEQAEQVKRLLINQKAFVEAYADYRAKYLIETKNCPLALTRCSIIWQVAYDHDFMQFLYPKEATFVSIENLAIPKDAQKDDLVYQFINFLCEPHIQAKPTSVSRVYPANPDAISLTDNVPDYYTTYREALKRKKFIILDYLLTQEETRNLWVDLKINHPKPHQADSLN